MDNRDKLFLDQNLPGLLKLHNYAATSGLSDNSSTSIHPKFREACDHVILRSHELFNFIPRYAKLYASFRQAGYPSGMFGFGGSRMIDGVWTKVSVVDHTLLLATFAKEFHRPHLEYIDKLADGFGTIPTIAREYTSNPPARQH